MKTKKTKKTEKTEHTRSAAMKRIAVKVRALAKAIKAEKGEFSFFLFAAEDFGPGHDAVTTADCSPGLAMQAVTRFVFE